MATTTTTHKNGSTSPARVLIVSCDALSHAYASAKLSNIYASAGHHVTLAVASGPALDLVRFETKEAKQGIITCVAVGKTTTKEFMHERQVPDPHSLGVLWESLKDPFPISRVVHKIMIVDQESTYEPVKELIRQGNFDLVLPMHSTAANVCDAVESMKDVEVPVAIFSSIPYDPAFYLGEFHSWKTPRSHTAFPHVGTYSSIPPQNIFAYLIRILWQLLDALLTERAWARTFAEFDRTRAQRGLPPTKTGWRGYLKRYPVLSFGGVSPFLCDRPKIAPNVTCVGTLTNPSSTRVQIDPELQQWLDGASDGIIYVGFGTGTKLNKEEAVAVTKGLMTSLENYPQNIRVLFALRDSEQNRLRETIDEAMTAPPTSISDSHLEYVDGRLRIQQSVPQAALLSSGHVRVFVSHMGMGGFTEGVQGGVPFICYPSGSDQWYNAARACDAGIGVMVAHKMSNLSSLIHEVLNDAKMSTQAQQAGAALRSIDGEAIALDFLERNRKSDGKGAATLTTTAPSIRNRKQRRLQ